MWTFGRRIAAGFALSVVLLGIIGGVTYRAIEALTHTSYSVTHTHDVLHNIGALLSLLKDAETGSRGLVITGDETFLEPYHAAENMFPERMAALRRLTADNEAQQRRIAQLDTLTRSKMAVMQRTIELRRAEGFGGSAKLVQSGEGKRVMDQIRRVVDEMERDERELLRQRAAHVQAVTNNAHSTIVLGTLLCVAVMTLAGWFIVRSLSRQIGSAVHQVQSSSAELQSASNQQVSASAEQTTAMTEIATTISELLATSRQIAESAQRVAHIAADAVSSARAGDATVVRTHESVSAIRRQVDVIVAHMLELGKKSQEIGGVLEVINELAEQTNILAINATIEAAGAGDAGKRFAVVADEIRKLADRVGGSTKAIRSLVDDVRAAVNTTVMATEGGSKAVDAGTRQFADVTLSFKQIATLVATTTEAAKEIELSTKQQATAVEQVKLAIANVAQAARETAASSTQTFETSSQLTALSRDLVRLIEPRTIG